MDISNLDTIQENLRKQKEDEIRAHSSPNFYAILPATVRYDKELRYFDKIMYAEIAALSNKLGYCYASNSWLGKNYGITERSVSAAVTRLAEKGYISVNLERGQGMIGTSRKIFIVPRVAHDGTMVGVNKPNEGLEVGIPSLGTGTNVPVTTGTNVLTNSIKENSINNTNNTPDEATPLLDDSEVAYQLPEEMGRNGFLRLCKLYELLWQYTFDVPHLIHVKSHGAAAVKKLLDTHGELQAAMFIIIHFDWHGMSNDDKMAYKSLRDKAFPIPWIENAVPAYKAFIKTYMELDTDKEKYDSVLDVLKKITST